MGGDSPDNDGPQPTEKILDLPSTEMKSCCVLEVEKRPNFSINHVVNDPSILIIELNSPRTIYLCLGYIFIGEEKRLRAAMNNIIMVYRAVGKLASRKNEEQYKYKILRPDEFDDDGLGVPVLRF
jgi:hypothetical protein